MSSGQQDRKGLREIEWAERWVSDLRAVAHSIGTDSFEFGEELARLELNKAMSCISLAVAHIQTAEAVRTGKTPNLGPTKKREKR